MSRRRSRRPHNGNGHATHDRRGFYRLPANARIAAVEIADPYGVPADATAKLKPGLRHDGTHAHGAPEWHAPEPPRLVVVRSLRGDQIARMEARHQISEAQFAAGRHYQALHEAAFASPLRSLDPARPVIDGGRYVEPFNDRQRRATQRLRVVDGSIVLRFGIDVLVLVHAVLLGGRSIASAARQQPGGMPVKFWACAFRLALDEVAALAGLATKPERQPLPERCALQAAVMVASVLKVAL